MNAAHDTKVIHSAETIRPMDTSQPGTDIYLITGFLGSGKTTFLKGRLARTARRTGVLVNDFGKINFDGLQMQRAGLEMVELSNGSIFCSCLKENFIEGLVHLVQLGLDDIYIESSGLADPSEMNKIVNLLRQKTAVHTFRFCGTICLVDGFYFRKVLPKILSVERQIRHSHLLLINKCDLIDEMELTLIHDTIKQMNPNARIVETTYGQLDWPLPQSVWFEIPDEETTNKVETRNKNLVLHLIREPEFDRFRAFLNTVSSYFFRIKGFVHIDGQLYQVDLVNEQIGLEPITTPNKPDGINQLVCLTSRGLESISFLAKTIDQQLPGHFRLEM